MFANTSTYLVKGTLKNYFGGTAYVKLLRWDGSQYAVSDSSSIVKSNFTLMGKINKEEIAYLVLGRNRPIPIFLGPETFFVFGDLNNVKKVTILGGYTQKKYNSLKNELKVIDDKLSQLEVKYALAEKQGKKFVIKSLEAESVQIHKEKQEMIKEHVNSNLKSLLSVYLVESQLQAFLTNEELEFYVDAFKKNGFGNEHRVEAMLEKVSIVKRVEIGQVAPEITGVNDKGDTVNLSDHRGKYVLIDFWASWSAPCRLEIPFLASIYQKFKEAKFEVFSVSLDSDKSRWLKNIVEDKLIWTNIIDIAGLDSEIVKMYAVTSIPANILLDPDGVILAKNLKEQEMSDMLEELLTSKK